MEYNEYRGVRGLVIAEITTDDGTTYEAGMWKKLSGVQAIATASNESSETHYYDNVPAIVISSEGSDDLTLTVSVLDLKTRALIEGLDYNETNKVFIKTPKNKKYFALGFIGKKTDGTEEFNIYYKGKFSGGNTTHNTENDGTEATNVEYTFTAIHTTTKIAQTKTKTAKGVIVPTSEAVTEEKIFGTFTDDTSTIKPLTPDEIVALTAGA